MNVFIDGIVAMRNGEPYVRLHVDGKVAQLSMAEARKVATDILTLAARSEADAMIRRFFSRSEFPDGAADALMMEFREFRLRLDMEPIQAAHLNPETGGEVQ